MTTATSKFIPGEQRSCVQCCAVFIAKSARHSFCCEKCKNDYNNAHRKVFTKICEHCGESYETTQRRQRFCSLSCSISGVEVIRTVTCRDCGVTFERKGRGHQWYCTPCRNKRNVMYTNASSLKRDPTKKVGVGSGNAQWREANHAWNPDGRYHDYVRSQGYESGFTRVCYDNWKKACAVDNTHVGVIDVHHINGVRNDNRPGNLVPLCRKCHGKLHHTFKPKTEQEYIAATLEILNTECRNKIAELNGKAEKPIRTEEYAKHTQGQSIAGEKI